MCHLSFRSHILIQTNINPGQEGDNMYYYDLPVNIRSMRYRFPPYIDFYFPEITGMSDARIQQSMNNQIIQMMNRLIAQFDRPDLTTYITGSFLIKANEENVLSMVLHALGDFGGAHPMTYIGALNFDVLTGENKSLSSQFKSGSNYVKRLSDMVAEQIKEREIPVLDEFKEINPEQNFYVADNVLILYYDLYDLSPYAAGFPYFPIPLYKIQDIIAEDSLLDRLTYVI